MHLSLLSDSFLSDSLDDGGWPEELILVKPFGQRHQEGLLRGIVFVAALILPFAVSFGSEALHAATGHLLLAPAAEHATH